jgi:hypothetical protein
VVEKLVVVVEATEFSVVGGKLAVVVGGKVVVVVGSELDVVGGKVKFKKKLVKLNENKGNPGKSMENRGK